MRDIITKEERLGLSCKPSLSDMKKIIKRDAYLIAVFFTIIVFHIFYLTLNLGA